MTDIPPQNPPWLPMQYWEEEMTQAGYGKICTETKTPFPRKNIKTPTSWSRRLEWSRIRKDNRGQSRNASRGVPTPEPEYILDTVGCPAPPLDHEDQQRQPTTWSQRSESPK